MTKTRFSTPLTNDHRFDCLANSRVYRLGLLLAIRKVFVPYTSEELIHILVNQAIEAQILLRAHWVVSSTF